MPVISNAHAVTFSQGRIRADADRLAQLYIEAKRTIQAWAALNMGETITNTTDLVVDGADGAGRSPITGAQATNIIVRLTEFVTDYEANNNAKLNTVLQVAPNP